MAEKKILIATATGSVVYCIVKQESTGWLLDDDDGGFRLSPSNIYISLTEDSVIKGRYSFSDDRLIWTDGFYTMTAYKQIGATPSPVADLILGIKQIYVKNNSEVFVEQSASIIDWSKLTPTIVVDISQTIGS